MSTVFAKSEYTPEDLLTMPDGDRFELVNGQLVELHMSSWSSYVAGEIYALVRQFSRSGRLGWVFPEGTSYQCFPTAPRLVRKPDTSFVRFGRFPGEQAPGGHIPIAPDLAVEVISPNDLAYDIDRKVQDYLDAGTPLVWIVNPDVHLVEVHRRAGTGLILRENDELDGGPVLPGFRCQVRELFLPPTGADQPS